VGDKLQNSPDVLRDLSMRDCRKAVGLEVRSTVAKISISIIDGSMSFPDYHPRLAHAARRKDQSKSLMIFDTCCPIFSHASWPFAKAVFPSRLDL